MSSFDISGGNDFGQIMQADDFRVVSLTPDLPMRSDMAEVFSHMEAKRSDRTFCSRGDVSPSELRKFLPWITILEPVFDTAGQVSDARYRLMGTEISMLYGEATGELISSYHGEAVQRRVCRIANHCLETRAAAIGLSKALSNGRHSVDVSVLYIPLSADGETVSQFLIYSAVERRMVPRSGPLGS